ncbi:hypothetical protein TTHERM_00338070 (macronuclear) [Tetrahymena thermophila SB210]|uniref:Uncharacterized protein n=1 Tax=Tetrahymena thermophila (strain SB210) TaxID=312017 RepID=I7MJY9_TETTS|nr:hypothetical protein TTHERM_00338070 [Tetrahymena thermophila SB210]EAR97328.1 hypothetical protein TTHERM_00338070 [Tetrahymena thermophila SB210]|eukprot:XP_001017573.1 hypothetical protein TTHERM_00338070 [Tetrahymena thermophila SB210]
MSLKTTYEDLYNILNSQGINQFKSNQQTKLNISTNENNLSTQNESDQNTQQQQNYSNKLSIPNTNKFNRNSFGIDEIFYSYQKRFQNVFYLIEQKLNFLKHQVFSFRSLQIKDALRQNKEQQNSMHEQSNIQCNSTNQNGESEQFKLQIIRKEICKENLITEKQAFEQNILTKLKEFYNHFVFLCKQDLDIIEVEQKVLKKYFSVKADSEKLKMIVVSLTNQIISENFLIYNNLLKYKFLVEANEFLQKQILFRKKLQEMIADKNQILNSIILYLINFSRSAFLFEKEQSEKIIVQKLQYYKQLEQQIQQVVKQQSISQSQNILDSQTNYMGNAQKAQQYCNAQLDICNTENNVQNNLESQLINDINSEYQKEKNKKQCNNKQAQQQDNNMVQSYQCQSLSPRVLQNNSQRPSLFFKQIKNEKNISDNYDLYSLANNSENQKQKQDMRCNQNFSNLNDQLSKIFFDENQSNQNCMLQQDNLMKQGRSQSLYNQKAQQEPFNNQIEEIFDQNILNNTYKKQQNIKFQTQNSGHENFSLSPISSSSRSFLKLPKLQQPLQILNSFVKKINDNSQNESPQTIHNNFNKRESLVHTNESESFIGNQQTNLSEIQTSKSINFDNQIYYQNEQSNLKGGNPSSSKDFKSSLQHKELYFSNQSFQQTQASSTPSISKSEYFFSIQSQLKKTDLINSKDFRRLTFTASNHYKKKWKIQQKCNFDDYSQLDCQYHHLACQQILNSIEILNDKKIFLEKMYTNLIKTNSYISQSIKSYLQQIPNKVRKNSYAKSIQSFQNINASQQNATNESKLNTPVQDCSIIIKVNQMNNKAQINQNNSDTPSRAIQNKPYSNLQVIQKSFSNSVIKMQANSDSNSKQNKIKTNQAKLINLAVVTTPKSNSRQRQPGVQNCLSLVNQSESPFFSKSFTKKLNEEILQQSNLKKFSDETFLEQKTNEKQQSLLITKSNSVLLKKHSDTLISESQSVHQTNSPNTIKSLKDKLIRIKTIFDKQPPPPPTIQQKQKQFQNQQLKNNQVQQQHMSIDDLIEPLIFKQNIFNTQELPLQQNDQHFKKRQQSPNSLMKSATTNSIEQINSFSKNSPNQRIQFIFLKEPNNKLNQGQKEASQDIRVQAQNGQSSTPRNLNNNMMNFYSNANANNSSLKLQNYKSSLQNLQISPYPVKKQKNEIYNNLQPKNTKNDSLIISRQFSENSIQKMSAKNYLDISYIQMNSQNNNLKDDNEAFKDQKFNQNFRNKLQIFNKKLNNQNIK